MALEMLTKLLAHFKSRLLLALYIVERCTSNEPEPSPTSSFLLDLALKIAPLRPHNPSKWGLYPAEWAIGSSETSEKR